MKEYLGLKDFINFCLGNEKIELTEKERTKMIASRKLLERLAKDNQIYGVNTGVGALFKKSIDAKEIVKFQENLILSHACGAGKPLEKEIVKGMMLLLINSLRKGSSGIRLETLGLLVEMFNQDLIPVVPEKGSVGASGDLAPLAHLALALIGKGHIWQQDFFQVNHEAYEDDAVNVFENAGLQPVSLQAGEAIALINGTHFSTSLLGFLISEAENLVKLADLVSAMTVRALNGKLEPFDEEIQRLKLHFGQKVSARNLRLLLREKRRTKNEEFVHDSYSLRCIPQVHGSVRDTISFAKKVVEKEINSISGNPVISIKKKRIYSGGNFHCQSLSVTADMLSIALSTLANISERRIERLLNPNLSKLPAFLSSDPGLSSGLMITQNIAASLVSENKVLSHPASVDSIPLSAGQEDFVSFSATAVLKAKQVLENVQYVLAIEILCASQALDFCDDLADSGVREAHKIVRKYVAHLEEDRVLKKDIETLFNLIKQGTILKKLEQYYKLN